MSAAAGENSECLSALIQAKADLNLQNKVRWSEAVGLAHPWHHEKRV